MYIKKQNNMKYILVLFLVLLITFIISSRIPTSSEYLQLIERLEVKQKDLTGSIRIPAIENNILKLNQIKSTETYQNICVKSHFNYRMQAFSSNPLVVTCVSKTSPEVRIITNGEWAYTLNKNNQFIIGHNEQYILLSDFDLIDMKTGEIITDNVLKKNVKKNVYGQFNHYYAATVSKNKRFFTFDFDDRTISEISHQGNKRKIVKLPKTYLGYTNVKNMAASDDGNYLFLLAEESRRGDGDLYFYMVEVKSKSVIYQYVLEENSHNYYGNINYEKGNVLINFESRQDKYSIISYWFKFKLNKESI